MKMDILKVKELALSVAVPSQIHGLSHWERVEKNGIILARETGANLIVVRLFSYFHDCCRLNDHNDPDHGRRASELIRSHRSGLLSRLTDEEFNQLTFACDNHTRLIRSEDETVNTCWDADRLDLSRTGERIRPELMATSIGSSIAVNPDMFKLLSGFSLDFSQEKYQIEKSNRQYVIRISSLNPVTMFFCDSWNFSAKSVYDPSGNGIYGMLMQMYVLGYDWFFRLLLSFNPDIQDIRVLILEIDKGDIVLQNVNEVAFRRANIYATYTASQFVSFAHSFPYLNAFNVAETIKKCSKAGIYFGLNDFDNWLKYMALSYEDMMLIRSANSPNTPAFQGRKNYREMFEPMFKAMKNIERKRENIYTGIK